MRKKFVIGVSLLSLVFALESCSDVAKSEKEKANATDTTVDVEKEDILTSTVLSKEEQEKLTPKDVLAKLKAGNKEFTDDNLTVRNNSKRVRAAAEGQYPKAVVLSCLDSRVPVEDVFHCGIGDLFVARVAGNIVNEDILGSLEYACKVSGSKLIVVLGHGRCGAVNSAIKNVKLGNITPLLSKIRPAVAAAEKGFEGEKSVNNSEFVAAVSDKNIELAIAEIRKRSPILKEMEDKGEIMIVGGMYDIETGEVDFED